MNFLRKYMVITEVEGENIFTYFNTFKDAKDYTIAQRRRYPYRKYLLFMKVEV
jgi:hypothetical protein